MQGYSLSNNKCKNAFDRPEYHFWETGSIRRVFARTVRDSVRAVHDFVLRLPHAPRPRLSIKQKATPRTDRFSGNGVKTVLGSCIGVCILFFFRVFVCTCLCMFIGLTQAKNCIKHSFPPLPCQKKLKVAAR
ncbi:uncharacterized protein FA14DRAFT_160988 [Meira miltonrushii]|uniref:Uncharacterized protein n=1 Tax=Meira miltonrushii TaxID=1280837 RepID=A0A316VF31_9BASI|nr:uncharacterized protein FA14DRAFT_160988 [Meira miltonrushii]PWN36126.1 hypothetical protein FA14DRAFT_160988 [Meira miltonrushii]